jgi:hypothetical protein
MHLSLRLGSLSLLPRLAPRPSFIVIVGTTTAFPSPHTTPLLLSYLGGVA